MRALIRQAIIDDVTLAAQGITPGGVLMGNVDTPAMRPWLNLRWGDTTPGIGPVGSRVLVVYVHDQPADYTRIDAILRRIKGLFSELEGDQHADGWLVKLDWITDSGDLADDGHGTIVRTTTHAVVGSGL